MKREIKHLAQFLTIMDDLFLAHVGSMDSFGRGMLIVQDILEKSDYLERRKARYSS